MSYDKKEICNTIDQKEDELDAYNVLFFQFDGPDYQESYLIFLESIENKKIYIAHDAHCSCDGFGELCPEESSIDVMEHYASGKAGCLLEEEKKELAEAIEKYKSNKDNKCNT